MKYAKLFTFLSIFTLSSSSLAESGIDNVRWIAQSYPPYSYVDADGAKKGAAIDQVAQIFKNTGAKKAIQDIEIKTFSKMFIHSNNDKNTVFFPLAKLPGRESMFKWVGPIFIDKPVVFAKSGITISKANDLKNYKIAGRDGYHGTKQLEDLDVSIRPTDNDQESVTKLQKAQVDMVVCDELSGLFAMKKLGMNQADYKVVYRLNTAEMFYAFNKDTDDAIIKQVGQAMKNSGQK